MLKLITKIELQSIMDQEPRFRRAPLIQPFGSLKTTTSREDSGELTTVNLAATVARDVDFLHAPSIVRVSWLGGSMTIGTKDYPVQFTVTEDDKVEITVKYLSGARL